MKNKEKKSYWEWTFKKWYFWMIVIAHSLLISVDENFGYLMKVSPTSILISIVMHFAISVVLCSFLFWAFYLIFIKIEWRRR